MRLNGTQPYPGDRSSQAANSVAAGDAESDPVTGHAAQRGELAKTAGLGASGESDKNPTLQRDIRVC